MRVPCFYNSSFGKVHLRKNFKGVTVIETAAPKGVVSYGVVMARKN